MTNRKRELESLHEIEKAFWYAEKGDAFSGYGKKIVTASIETIRAALTEPEAPTSEEVNGALSQFSFLMEMLDSNLKNFTDTQRYEIFLRVMQMRKNGTEEVIRRVLRAAASAQKTEVECVTRPELADDLYGSLPASRSEKWSIPDFMDALQQYKGGLKIVANKEDNNV